MGGEAGDGTREFDLRKGLEVKERKEMATGNGVMLEGKQHIFHMNCSWGLEI